MLGLGKLSDKHKFKKFEENLDNQKILEVLTNGKGEWKGSKNNTHISIAKGYLTEEAKVWFYVLNSVLMPSKHVCTVRKEEAILIFAILKGYMIGFGKIIENSILGYQSSNF